MLVRNQITLGKETKKRDLLISFDLIRELTAFLSPNSAVALNNHETQDYSKCER